VPLVDAELLEARYGYSEYEQDTTKTEV